jgi:serine phosphatase RsbU (regulator of sigma subunit)
MSGPFRASSEQSPAGAIRRWLTGTFAGRALLGALVVKLFVKLARLGFTTRALEVLDTLADITLVVVIVLLVRRLIIDTRGLLLWRVRRKLTLSYIFIGFVPVLLIVVFFLVAGLILFYNVSQYVAVARIKSLVEQTAFLAESAAVGLQDAGRPDEIRQRLRRRQAGAAGTYPFVSYAIVPAETCTDADVSLSQRLRVVREPIAVGPWAHLDPPREIPGWTPCATSSDLVAYTDTTQKLSGEEPVSVHLSTRAVAWPDRAGVGYGVVVDIPLSTALLARMKSETGIDYIVGDVSALGKECAGTPLPGRSLDGDQRSASVARRTLNPLAYPLDWLMWQRFVDWNSGDECQAFIHIRMTLGEVYRRVASTIAGPPLTGTLDTNERLVELIRNPITVLLSILAVIVMLFLVIQAVAFIMGLALARSITGSIHELFTGTERVRLGDFTHKIPIRSRDQLGELAESFNSMTRSIADLLDQKAEKERMEQELRIARTIQMSLLPREHVTIPGLAVTAHCEPAREVGGDYYDYMEIGGRLNLLIADVAGKGTSAALYMAELKGLMLSLSQLHTSPRELLINANRIISRHLDSKSFITITYAVVDVARRTLTYARAGHCPLIYVPGSYAPSRAAQILAPDGLVLGLQIDDGGQRFTRLLEEVTIPLGTGDVFLFYTDGLTEAMDQDGNCFGDTRLAAVVLEHADAPFGELRDTILREIAAFAGPTAQQDDMTMLLLRVEEVGQITAERLGAPVA